MDVRGKLPVCVCVIPHPLVVQQTIVCNSGQAFEQGQRVVRGNVLSPPTQADQKTETCIKQFILTTMMFSVYILDELSSVSLFCLYYTCKVETILP